MKNITGKLLVLRTVNQFNIMALIIKPFSVFTLKNEKINKQINIFNKIHCGLTNSLSEHPSPGNLTVQESSVGAVQSAEFLKQSTL